MVAKFVQLTSISILRRLLNKSKKTEETVETTLVKRRGILGKIGLKKKEKVAKNDEPIAEDAAEETPVVENVVSTHSAHAEEAHTEEAKPLEPEAEKKDEEPTEERDIVEPKEEESAPIEEEPKEAAAEPFEETEVIEEREQPEQSATPRDAPSTGFLCGCI